MSDEPTLTVANLELKRNWDLEDFETIAGILQHKTEDEQERLLRALVVFFEVDA